MLGGRDNEAYSLLELSSFLSRRKVVEKSFSELGGYLALIVAFMSREKLGNGFRLRS